MQLTYDDRRIELGGATLEAPYPVTGATVLDDVAVVRETGSVDKRLRLTATNMGRFARKESSCAYTYPVNYSNMLLQ